MILKDFRVFFRNALSEIYPATEIDSFFFLLIEEYLGLERIDTVLKPDFKIDEDKLSMLKNCIKKLQKEEPIQYIIGKTEFYGLPFYVDKNTLIPRPETEELVAWIIEEVAEFKNKKQLSILDIGTGSGCIPISLVSNLSESIITAIDVSTEAINIAKKNADLNKVNVNFINANILRTPKLFKNFDVIVSNPPYVRELEKVEIQNNVLENEPHLALFVSNDNPLIFYDKIADLAKKHLTKNGVLFFEINEYLATETLEMLKAKGFNKTELRKDLFGKNRMIKAKLI